jgi:hypothetical protein
LTNAFDTIANGRSSAYNQVGLLKRSRGPEYMLMWTKVLEGDSGGEGFRFCLFRGAVHTGSSLLQPAAIPLRGLTVADAPLINTEILFRQPGPVRKPDVLGLACSRVLRNNACRTGEGGARAMSKSDDAGFDFDRYRRLLAEADDEPKRLAFINLLVDEKAKDKLAGQALRGRLAELGLQTKK